jgi:hypothetical protein
MERDLFIDVDKAQEDFLDEKSHIPFDTIKTQDNDNIRDTTRETFKL